MLIIAGQTSAMYGSRSKSVSAGWNCGIGSMPALSVSHSAAVVRGSWRYISQCLCLLCLLCHVSVSAVLRHHRFSSEPVFQPSAIELFQSPLSDWSSCPRRKSRDRRHWLFF